MSITRRGQHQDPKTTKKKMDQNNPMDVKKKKMDPDNPMDKKKKMSLVADQHVR